MTKSATFFVESITGLISSPMAGAARLAVFNEDRNCNTL